MVVVLRLVLDHHLGLGKAGEQLDVEQLVAHPSAERLDIWVLPGRTRVDVGAPGPREAQRKALALLVGHGPLRLGVSLALLQAFDIVGHQRSLRRTCSGGAVSASCRFSSGPFRTGRTLTRTGPNLGFRAMLFRTASY